MLLVCLFDVPEDERVDFTARARTAVALLSAQPGCRGATAGPSVDEPDAWVLTARFDSVPAYRRALSPFEVREHVAPLLARCRDGVPTTFELLLDGVDGAVAASESLRARGSGPRPGTAEPGRDDR